MEDQLILEIRDLGSVTIKLEPAVSPMTYARLVRSLPTKMNLIRYGQIIIIPIDLGLVSEGRRTSMKPLEVGYWVKKRSLVVSLGNVDLGEPINVIGYVTSGAELLSKINGGAFVRLFINK
ncbi:hypothetical protein [Vulcanisaeta thermophila]|uniref:hypothetical protein n=1 Tax=Vulcanisaeta thermophila TaxID=867917 RepID=UPI000853D2FB|nr:hypothetical protein [Vulcanisaeta thermophila]